MVSDDAVDRDHLVDEFGRMVKRLARKYGRYGVDPDDLESEAWIVILEGWGEFDPSLSPANHFAFIKAKAGMWNCVRRESHRKMAVIDGETLPDPGTAEPSEGLVRLLRSLTDREAEAVSLRCGFDGTAERSYEDVAWIMKISRQVAYQRWNLAAEKLRERLTSSNPCGPVTPER